LNRKAAKDAKEGINQDLFGFKQNKSFSFLILTLRSLRLCGDKDFKLLGRERIGFRSKGELL
jgi:hypothetical protein